jgi:hypothetical protein
MMDASIALLVHIYFPLFPHLQTPKNEEEEQIYMSHGEKEQTKGMRG